MFAIQRYDISSDEKSLQDKDKKLKDLINDAISRKGKKRKSQSQATDATPEDRVDDTKEGLKSHYFHDIQSTEVKTTSSKDGISQVFDSQGATKVTDSEEYQCNEHGNTQKDKSDDHPKHEETNYDPFAMFKKRVKSTKNLLSSDLAKAARDSLPEWVQYPQCIKNDIIGSGSAEESFPPSIEPMVVENLKNMGVNSLFPVQISVIPTISRDFNCKRPNDICVCSPTGSGKTLAFAIPIVHYVFHHKLRNTSALVIIPTIELAKQVHQVFISISKKLNIHCVLLGSSTVETDIQQLKKRSKYGFLLCPEIIVSTPGRFTHMLEVSELLCLKQLRFLVVDEADRILDLVKQSWLSKLKEKVPHWKPTSRIPLKTLCKPEKYVQKLLFSATLNPDPEKLKDLDLFRPMLFVPATDNPVGKVSAIKSSHYVLPPTLSQYMVRCEANIKPLYIARLFSELKVKKALCFTRSAESARRLHLVLNYYVERKLLQTCCLEFSSLLTKKVRRQNMTKFTSSEECILVSSDAAARGIDAADIEMVVIYDIPQYIEAYVHRAGRASRAGNKGSVYSLVTNDNEQSFKQLFRKAGLRIPEDYLIDTDSISSFSDEYENALSYCQKMSAKS